MQAESRPQLLRSGLLEGLDVVVCAAGEEVSATLGGLGADVRPLDADLLDEDALTAAAAAIERGTVLVCDAGPIMRTREDAAAGLRDAVAGAWNATRVVVNVHLAPGGFGKVILIAPRPRDGARAEAAGAALENLARTTSVEWARLGIRVVAVRPRDVTSEAALAQVVAYLASPAGDYLTGCVLDLGVAELG